MTNTTTRALAALLAAFIIAATLAAPSPASAAISVRFGGNNRYDTARILSQKLDHCAVIVANGETFADGLAAAVFGLPILLTRADALPAETVAELERLDAKCNGLDGLGVIGGTAAVSLAVQDQLQQYANPPVVRIDGANRYETAANVGFEYKDGFPTPEKSVVITTGQDFPDALAVGPGSALYGIPILLNDGPSLRPEVVEFLQLVDTNFVAILGGPAAVPETVDNQIQSQFGMVPARIAGGNRFETAVQVADASFPNPDCTLLVNGNAFPDALAAGPAGALGECPIVLTNQASLPPATNKWLIDNAGTLNEVIAIGGTAAISDATLAAAVAAAT